MPTGFAAATLVAALIVRRAAAEYRGPIVLQCGNPCRQS
jgi:hypothetical protein